MSEQYKDQENYVQQQWRKTISGMADGDFLAVTEDGLTTLREIALHIFYETYVENDRVETWSCKLQSLKNRRYEVRKY